MNMMILILARLGANVTGVDACKENIDIAKEKRNFERIEA